MSAPETVIVHTDGASRGNPGPASIGVVIAEPSGHVLREFGEALAPTTNNVAEYTAVIRALESALELGARRVQVQMDSQLVVRQLNGSYRVKHPDMLPLYRRVLELIQRFEEVTFAHVPREQNTEADRLANAALDRVPAEESAVARVFKLLVDGKTDEASEVLSTDFKYRRGSDERSADAEAFLSAWARFLARRESTRGAGRVPAGSRRRSGSRVPTSSSRRAGRRKQSSGSAALATERSRASPSIATRSLDAIIG